MDSNLNKVLVARESRALLRSNISSKGYASLSLSLNIPGYPKSNDLTNSVFDIIITELLTFLRANRININGKDELTILDDDGNFFLVSIDPKKDDLQELKILTENFEESYALGRITDVDVFDDNARPISSGKGKKCIICDDRPAVQCMREKNHTYDDLRSIMFNLIGNYLDDYNTKKVKNLLSSIATKALLYEVSLSPKPGLVDFNDSGSHIDMNYFSFLNSISALSVYWKDFAESGLSFKGDLSNALPLIRNIGLKAEEAMFKQTNGVNTQKGLIFLLGLSVFSSAYEYSINAKFSIENIRSHIITISGKLVEKELNVSSKNESTHGEITFKKYGFKGAGVRAEAEKGFPILFEKSLPFLMDNLNSKSSVDNDYFEETLKKALLMIMSELNDSNVLYRNGSQMADKLKSMALSAINNKTNYSKLNEFCLKENISPGGSADMLALSIFYFFVNQELS